MSLHSRERSARARRAASPFVVDLSLGVRRGEEAFCAELEEILQRQRQEINRWLDDYGMPRVEAPGPRSAGQ